MQFVQIMLRTRGTKLLFFPEAKPIGGAERIVMGLLCIIAALALVQTSAADHTPVPIFSTGVGPDGITLPPGSIDIHYNRLSIPAVSAVSIFSPLPPLYLPNTSASAWIWLMPSGQPSNVTLTFRTEFDLTGLDPDMVVLQGAWATDNTGIDILLNGVSTGINLPGTGPGNYSNLHAFNISYLNFPFFLPRVNTLDFVVQDTSGSGGLRVEISGTTNLGCTVGVDSDGDGILDEDDNCCHAQNAPQPEIDTDGDGYGNACDKDFNNDGIVNLFDLGLFKAAFFTSNPLYDCNGDGVVNFFDLGVLRQTFFHPPGPSCVDLPAGNQGSLCP